jgi:DNA modification methylase
MTAQPNTSGPRLRNTGLRRVRVADLADAPWNHRTHPQSQAQALDGAIDELGFYGFPDVFEADGGVLMLIDGHLRKERLLAKYGAGAEIEVNVTDFDEAEAKKANLTKDPLAAMAETNAAKLDELLRDCQTGSAALASMLTDMAKQAGCEWAKQGEVVEDEVPEPPADPVTKPGDLWLLGVFYKCECGGITDGDLQELREGVCGDSLQPEVLRRRVQGGTSGSSTGEVQANGKGEGDGAAVASQPKEKGRRQEVLHEPTGEGNSSSKADAPVAKTILPGAKATPRAGGLQDFKEPEDQGNWQVPVLRGTDKADARSRSSDVEGRASPGEQCASPLRVMQCEKEATNHPLCCRSGKQLEVKHRDSRHRILCGDSTKAEDVSRVLGGRKPFIMVTDPPYGVEYDPEWRLNAGLNKEWQTRAEGKVANDDQVDWSATYRLSPTHVAYVWHAGRHAADLVVNLRAAEFDVRTQIIWSKPSLVIGRGHYHWQHEPCWYAVRKGGSAKWCGDRTQSTIWVIKNMHRTQGDVDDGKTIHGTQKPVECMARPIRNHGGKDDDVYDPFLGSGTTIIAAEQLGRRCFGLELEPKYCDVICQRWAKLTGKTPTLEDGTPFPVLEVQHA